MGCCMDTPKDVRHRDKNESKNDSLMKRNKNSAQKSEPKDVNDHLLILNDFISTKKHMNILLDRSVFATLLTDVRANWSDKMK